MTGCCWWCYHGWPKPIYDIYKRAVDKLGSTIPLECGPAHIVWSDENFDCAQWCLDNFDKYKGDYSEEELEIIKQSLYELLEVSDEFKAEPAGYDGDRPENYPPPDHWEMIV